MRYWWVNHKQTSRFEIPGGFLWSPMRKANGSKNYFYDTMREASPGDLVISFSYAQIRFIGIVADFAIPAPKPPSFGDTGENWDKKNGWLLPVKWMPLENPVRPKQKIDELRAALPAKYSPISLTSGDGNQGAYLASVEKSVFDMLIPSVSLNVDRGVPPLSTVSGALAEIDHAIESKILADKNLDDTVKQCLIDSRVGQGVFKKRIYEFESCCRITQVITSGLLIASHIKPWRLCESAEERLDGANGLLLTPSADLLFDHGFITFGDAGNIVVSERIKKEDIFLLGWVRFTRHRVRAFIVAKSIICVFIVIMCF